MISNQNLDPRNLGKPACFCERGTPVGVRLADATSAAPAQIPQLLFQKRQPIFERLTIPPLTARLKLPHHAGALEQEAVALAFIIHLLRGQLHSRSDMPLFGRSNLLFYRLTFPTTRHYSIVRAPKLACGEKCLDSYYYAAVDRTKIAKRGGLRLRRRRNNALETHINRKIAVLFVAVADDQPP